MLKTYLLLESIARGFKEIVLDTRIIELPSGEPSKLRIELMDRSFADVWISATGKYSFHWDRLEINGTIYRYDNAPHNAWADIESFPHHFHNKEEKSVMKSDLSRSQPEIQIKQFLDFIRNILINESQQ